MNKPNRIPDETLDEATIWFVEFSENDVSQAQRQQFIAWLRTSPEHIRAYLQITAHWEDARALQSSRRHSIDELVALARTDSNVVPLQAPLKVPVQAPVSGISSGFLSQQSDRYQTTGETPKRAHVIGTFERKFSIAASIALVAIGSLAWYWYNYQLNTYTTAIGEQRSITLADGSTVELNSRSKIRVAYHDRERDIQLLNGQALFHVAKDRTRPFIVHTNTTNVRAVGTQFDVYQKNNATVVTVVEGIVAVIPGNGQGIGGGVHGGPSTTPGSTAQTQRGSAAPSPTPGSSAAQPQHGSVAPPLAPALSVDGEGPHPLGAVGSAFSESSEKVEEESKSDSLSSVPRQGEDAASEARGGRGPSPPSGEGWGEYRQGTVFLSAGEQLTVTGTQIERAEHPDLPGATAWTQKQIAFNRTPLTEVVEEFNRYNTRQLIITDSTIAGTRISGVFSSTDPASLLRGLDTLGKFTIRESSDHVEISSK